MKTMANNYSAMWNALSRLEETADAHEILYDLCAYLGSAKTRGALAKIAEKYNVTL